MNDFQEVNKRIDEFSKELIKDFVVMYKDIIVGLNIVKEINSTLCFDEISDKNLFLYETSIKKYLETKPYIIFNKQMMYGINHALEIVNAVAVKKKTLNK